MNEVQMTFKEAIGLEEKWEQYGQQYQVHLDHINQTEEEIRILK
jgi:hypothetical protein